MSFKNLYDLYENEKGDDKKSPENGHNKIASKKLNNGETMANKTETGLIARGNHFTKKHLGTVGRPLVVGAGTTAGVYYGSGYFGNQWELRDSVIAGGLTAAVVELGFHYFGDTTAIEALEAGRTIARVEQSTWAKDLNQLENEMRAAGGGNNEVSAITGSMIKLRQAREASNNKPQVESKAQ